MDGCEVNTRYLVCKNMGRYCAFLKNEKINDGSTSNLEKALSLEDDSYLSKLIDNRAGSGFRGCQAHQIIVDAAIRVLESR